MNLAGIIYVVITFLLILGVLWGIFGFIPGIVLLILALNEKDKIKKKKLYKWMWVCFAGIIVMIVCFFLFFILNVVFSIFTGHPMTSTSLPSLNQSTK